MRARLRASARHSFAVALVPLSMLPFAALYPLVISHALQHGRGVRLHGGEEPWPVPNIAVSAAALARFKLPPAYSGQIPVLLFHGINYRNDIYSVPPKSFARELALLQQLGYHTISIGQYVAWRQGKSVTLPSRPILITFDDGRFDSYRGADRILARYHMRATMFVIVAPVQSHNPFYLTWNEIARMQRSGRWDIQFHANNGHKLVVFDAKGRVGPYYAVREYADGRLESVPHYEARVEEDISRGLKSWPSTATNR